MPLGLLKCVVTWFSNHLSEEEFRLYLNSIKHRDPLINESFGALLDEWFRVGYLGKTSVEKFGNDLQQMFKSRCSFLSEQIKDKDFNVQPFEGLSSSRMEQLSNSCSSSSCSQSARKNETSYSSVINLHVYFPGAIKTLHPLSKLLAENHPGSVPSDPKPMDLIFYFHKALKNDLEYLALNSALLAENIGLLSDFSRRFHLVKFLFQTHSEAEDQVAFPALEEKGIFTNISHSYTMDHKLEAEHFARVSLILDEMSKLHVSVSNVDLLKHYQLSMQLHGMCKSMHKLLSDHIHHEEEQLWPLFRDCFSIEEQERIVGCILGRMKAEILQDMIPWVMASLTPEEQHTMMSLWRKVTRNTMFDEWLREWWEGCDMAKVAEESNSEPSYGADPLEIISTYLCDYNEQENTSYSKSIKLQEKEQEKDLLGCNAQWMGDCDVDGDKGKDSNFDQHDCSSLESKRTYAESDKKNIQETETFQSKGRPTFQADQKSKYCECLLTMTQTDLEAAIRRVSRDSSLDSERKTYIIQNLLMRLVRVSPYLLRYTYKAFSNSILEFEMFSSYYFRLLT